MESIPIVVSDPDVAFDIITAVTMKSAVFLDVTSWRQVQVYRCFGGTSCLHLQGGKSN
jgi:hypothetical protein